MIRDETWHGRTLRYKEHTISSGNTYQELDKTGFRSNKETAFLNNIHKKHYTLTPRSASSLYRNTILSITQCNLNNQICTTGKSPEISIPGADHLGINTKALVIIDFLGETQEILQIPTQKYINISYFSTLSFRLSVCLIKRTPTVQGLSVSVHFPNHLIVTDGYRLLMFLYFFFAPIYTLWLTQNLLVLLQSSCLLLPHSYAAKSS